MRTRTKRKSKLFLLTTLILFALIIAFSIILLNKLNIFNNKVSKDFNDNTYVNGINISGLSKAEAYETVSSYISNKANDFTLTLKYNDEIFTLDQDDYIINKDVDTILEHVSNPNKDTTNFDKLNYFIEKGNSTNVSFNYIFQGLNDKIEDICKKIETPAIDSEIHFNPNNDDMFEITPSQTGHIINRDKLYNRINEQFAKTSNVLIELELEESSPKITEEYNKSLTHKITEFSTDVSDSTGGRKHNVKLALEKFNGYVLKPGQSVSFNEITGPQTLENGYQIATIIYKGRFVDGVGGGICQASTTLYNALLLSGITIDEVHKHTLPVRYVPLALDAMVSEGSYDLKFTNNTGNPVFIKTSSTPNNVTVEIYSKPNEDNISYTTRSETIKVLPALQDKIIPDINQEYTDKVLFKGEKYRLTYGTDGYEVNSYLQTHQNGTLISEELIRHEIYQPTAGQIVEGVAEPLPDIQIIDTDYKNNPQASTSDHVPSNICP